MLYICKNCGYETEWTETDFASKGEPICPDCDEDMKPIGEDINNTCLSI